MSLNWHHLLAIADQEVRTLIDALPPDLKKQAETVPVSFDPRHQEELRTLDLEETLGLFVGSSHYEGDGSDPIPPQIILFLKNIWDFANADEVIYRQEVRTTYLHELGHFLGLEEIDLEERGL